MDLQAARAVASKIAKDAGAALMKTFDQPHQQRVKKTFNDIVTEGDMASEAVVVAGLREHFPDHRIVSEEGGGLGAGTEDAAYSWYVDPLDGTSNYASNIPFFTVSIGLADHAMQPLVGVVYDPFSDELYSAAKGYGATLNGRSLNVSAVDTLSQAMLCSGFPYDNATNPDNNMREWGVFTTHTRGLRRFGSVALELGYVASGRLDGLWEHRLNAWDIMAGIILVREAGGIVTDYSGQESETLYNGRQIIAGNAQLHRQMLAVLREVRG